MRPFMTEEFSSSQFLTVLSKQACKFLKPWNQISRRWSFQVLQPLEVELDHSLAKIIVSIELCDMKLTNCARTASEAVVFDDESAFIILESLEDLMKLGVDVGSVLVLRISYGLYFLPAL